MCKPAQRLAKSKSQCIMHCTAFEHIYLIQLAPFSKNSFASLIFVARYGLPPRSGWFNSISCRCFLRIISFVMPRSLLRACCQLPPVLRLACTPFCCLRCFQYQGCLSSIHLLLETAFVVCFPQCAGAPAGSAECYETCASLWIAINSVSGRVRCGQLTVVVVVMGERTKKAAAATPTPTARTVTMSKSYLGSVDVMYSCLFKGGVDGCYM